MATWKFELMAFSAIVLGAISYPLSASAAAEDLAMDVTPAEKKIIEKIRPYKSQTFKELGKQALDADGAKSFVYSVERQPAGVGLTEFRSINDLLLYSTSCYGKVVLARSHGSRSFINSSNTMVYTKSQFKILPGWIESQYENIQQNIWLFSYGGEVVESGQKYRVVFDGNNGYLRGHDYLIELDQSLGDNGKSFSGMGKLVEVKNGLIYPQTGEWYGFRTGARLTDIAKSIERVLSMRKCDQ
jgi:hypothetical protein